MNDDMPNPSDIMQQVQYQKRNFEAFCEVISMNAKLMRVSYENLISQGFTKDEAIDLIKAKGTLLS